MVLDKDIASKTADLLLQINAIKLRPENPFKWASGWNSPIYCDNRIILSYPEIRTFVRKEMARALIGKFGKPDVIAGVATGAIGIGALVADELDLPFVYVRPQAKSHGRQNQIEGQLDPDSRVVVIEDLVSTGNSSLKAVESLLENGAEVLGMLAIFTYGFEISKQQFTAKGVSLQTLTDYENVIRQAAETNYVREDQLLTLQEWSRNPSQWQSK